MSEEDLESCLYPYKYNMIEIGGERVLGMGKNVKRYLLHALSVTIQEYEADGWGMDETVPIVEDITGYLTMMEDDKMYTIEECPMSASNILVREFKEKNE